MHYLISTIFCSVFLYLLSCQQLANAFQVNNVEESRPEIGFSNEDGDFRYVTDELFTYLRAGPSPNYRLVGPITAGTKIKVLRIDEASGYMEVTDSRQRKGWIETKFVSQEASIRLQLETLNSLIEQRNIEYAEMQNQVANMKNKLSSVTTQNTALNRKVTEQLEQISILNENIENSQRGNIIEWFTKGGIVTLAALIIGYILGVIARKRGNSGRLM